MSVRERYLGEILRDEYIMRDRIIDLLRNDPKTIPEIAAALGERSHEVVRWIMAMRRYGIIEEIPKSRADDYYKYRLVKE